MIRKGLHGGDAEPTLNLLRFTIVKEKYDAATKCRLLNIRLTCPNTGMVLELSTRKIKDTGCTQEQGSITIPIELSRIQDIIRECNLVILTTRTETALFEITNVPSGPSWIQHPPQTERLLN
jgi:hypothetical protein